LVLFLVFISTIFLSTIPFFSFPNAFGYIDPGTGSVIVQMIIGGLVGVGIAVKVFWFRIKSALSPSFKKNNNDEDI
tara:strand:+ start:5945 stop:6172 length:228 start_codon:yes stop_codon:yes gene_type:complete